MNIKYSLIPGIIVADIATKNMNHFDVTNHYKHIPWWFLLALIPLTYVALGKPRYRLPASVCITGAIMNYLDALDGMVINPFILIVQRNAAAFNVADIAILLGFLICVKEAIKEKREKKRIGSVEWNNV